MKQEYRKSPLQPTFRKFYGRYNELVCEYSESLNEMLRCTFDSGCWKIGANWTRNCSSLFSLTVYYGLAAGVTGQQGMLISPWHLMQPLDFRGPCCPMLTEFVYMFLMFLTIDFNFGIFDSCILYIQIYLNLATWLKVPYYVSKTVIHII